MHIVLVGPIAGADIIEYLTVDDVPVQVPVGYSGAPLMGIIIGELLRLGHRVTGITTDALLPLAGGVIQREGPGFTFLVCPSRPRAWRFNGHHLGRAVDQFAFERRLLSGLIVQAKPDIVHAHWSYEFALAALAQSAPHLITCHDSPAVVLRFTRSLYRAVRYLMARRVFRCGREFSTVSDYMATELETLIGHEPEVIPNPVASHVFALGRNRKLTASRQVAMVCNGWDRRKNPEAALRAFAIWRAEEPEAELHLFGADFGAGEIGQQWARTEGLAAGLHFWGRLPHRELVVALAGVDVLLHPALEESFGVVLAEAMALGLPIVAGHTSGAVPAVLGSDAGGAAASAVLTNVESPTALALALAQVFDDGYAARSIAGRHRALSTYSPQVVVRSYAERYERILCNYSPPQAGLVTDGNGR